MSTDPDGSRRRRTGSAPRTATAEQVARLAGVSTATVSRVQNGTAVVSDQARERVLAAIRQLAYRPTREARNLRLRRTGNLALIVPSITNPFFPELVARLNAETRAREYALLLFEAAQPEQEAARIARSRLADGIIVIGSASAGRERASVDVGMPVVAIDRRPASLAAPLVQVDNVLGARTVMRHLGELGHRAIAFIGGPPGLAVSAERARGYRAGLRALAGSAQPLTVAGQFDEDSGYQAASRLITSGPRFTAVFAANDMMAIGALAALRDRDIPVPAQVAVAGFDGIHLDRYVVPALTSYAQPTAELAGVAVRMLAAAIEGHTPRRPAATRMAGELIVRSSTAGDS